jgi:hydroxymethylbilane synthase
MRKTIRIGTRESQLAVWQATTVKQLLESEGFPAELVYIKSEGDIDLVTPLYEMGVQGVFTRSLDIALLSGRIDIAVHSMKDVPTQLPKGIQQAAVLKRGPIHDLLVYKTDSKFLDDPYGEAIIATSSIRRIAQWLNRYPNHRMENLRGNVNTRLKKLASEDWDAAIFAQAGLERIGLRPETSVVLDWMLPAPSQGAIMIVCKTEDDFTYQACVALNDENTATCTNQEKAFLRTLMGGCSTPISALATIEHNEMIFQGSILSVDGKQKAEIQKRVPLSEAVNIGERAAFEILEKGGREISESIKHAKS